GLFGQLVIAFVAVRSGHFTLLGLACMTVAIIAAGALAAWRYGPRAWPAVEGPWVLATIALVALALVLRDHPSYFIFQTGDMGEYINLANQVANGVNLLQSFPHGFTLFLASTNVLLGQAHTVAGVPALGIVL